MYIALKEGKIDLESYPFNKSVKEKVQSNKDALALNLLLNN